MKDQYHREIDYVRISVTDKCNLNCTYCMPKGCAGYQSTSDLLEDNEIIQLCTALVKLGFKKVKITGGEPLVRKNIINLIKDIKHIKGIEEVTITTNGILLLNHLDGLKEAGIDGINVSIDALDPVLFEEITGYDKVDVVLKSIDDALALGIKNIKLNCVLIKELNLNQYVKIASLAGDKNVLVRFIEVMPIGIGSNYEVINAEDVKTMLESELGSFTPDNHDHGNGPAVYYNVPNFHGKVGFISAVSQKFCEKCNRIRITSDGVVKTCLHYNSSHSLRELLGNEEALISELKTIIYNKQEGHNFNSKEIDTQTEIKMMAQIGG